MSGRGVQLRALGPKAASRAEQNAAKLVGKDGTQADMFFITSQEYLQNTITAVTKTVGMKSQEELLTLPESDWIAVTYESLETSDSMSIDELFTAKDVSLLRDIMRQLYMPNMDASEAIMGKALKVAI